MIKKEIVTLCFCLNLRFHLIQINTVVILADTRVVTPSYFSYASMDLVDGTPIMCGSDFASPGLSRMK